MLSKNKSIETFRECDYEIDNLLQKEPSCFNCMVRIKKYRITVEEIKEPIEVLHQRLQSLWDYSTNHYDSDPLRSEAKKLNYELVNERGNKNKQS
jgi:DNA repair ATPase RecN